MSEGTMETGSKGAVPTTSMFSDEVRIAVKRVRWPKDDGHIDVSIVMPCLNEVKTLPDCILDAQDALKVMQNEMGLIGEVVIGDNGSSDGSDVIAIRMGARVIPVQKKGYGNALQGAIEASRGRYIIMADSDGSYDFHEAIPMVAKLIEGYDLCMGSRFKGTIMPGAMPWKNRYIGNPALSGVLNLVFRSGLSDAHSGIRGFTRDGYDRMRLESEGMEFASEMVIKATLVDLRRTEVPITLRPDKRDRPPHLRPFRDGWRHLRYIFMLSPSWVFFVPALLQGIVGAIIILALFLAPSNVVVRVGPFTFGDHWMIIAGTLIVASYLAALFGIATTLYGITAGYRKTTPLFAKLFRLINLETMLVAGLVLIGIGAALLALVFIQWSAAGFGSLNRIREVFGAATLVLLGMQTFFGGFLLAIIGGNKAQIYLTAQQPQKATMPFIEPASYEAAELANEGLQEAKNA